jgi:hypothetical protein
VDVFKADWLSGFRLDAAAPVADVEKQLGTGLRAVDEAKTLGVVPTNDSALFSHLRAILHDSAIV